MPTVGIDDVRVAAGRLRGIVHRTPVITSTSLDARVGASLCFKGEHLQRAGAFKLRGACNAIAAGRGATVIPPYDHPDVVAGQGTVALELVEEVGDLEVLVAPVGGGGLLSGCAVAARALAPGIELIGVEPEGRRAARDALDRGEVVEVPVPDTILDGQQTPEIGHLPLVLMRALGVRVIGVGDGEVEAAMRLLTERTKQVVEPSGASALAAVLSGRVPVAGRRVGVVVSGGNVEPRVLARVLAT